MSSVVRLLRAGCTVTMRILDVPAATGNLSKIELKGQSGIHGWGEFLWRPTARATSQPSLSGNKPSINAGESLVGAWNSNVDFYNEKRMKIVSSLPSCR
jgi:hypothetical protein